MVTKFERKAAAKQAVLIVSTGTAFSKNRESAVSIIAKNVEAAFPDYDIKTAFANRKIIDRLKACDGSDMDNLKDVMEKLAHEGYSRVIVQPVCVINGCEYNEMKKLCRRYEKCFAGIAYGAPLLFSEEDYVKVVKAVAAETPQMTEDDTAVIFVGHGTDHFSNAAYAALSYRFNAMGYRKTFVGTLRAYPNIEDIKAKVRESGAEKVVLLPFLIAAGVHAARDICGETEGSWYAEFQSAGYETEPIKRGLSEYEGICRIFIDHVQNAIDSGV